MAFIAAIAPYLTAAATIYSTVSTAQAQRKAGVDRKNAADFEAAQLEQQAGQTRASAQRQAIEQRRQSAIASSRALAVAGASGAGALDPTVVDLMAGIESAGDYSARVALFEGNEVAIGRETAASSRRYGGDQALQAGKTNAQATVVSGVTSMYSKYGGGGSPTATKASSSSSSRWNPNDADYN